MLSQLLLVTSLIVIVVHKHRVHANTSSLDLCYQIATGVGESYRKHVIRPVTALPAEHSSVVYGQCGTYNAGDPIPSDGEIYVLRYWRSRCDSADGGEFFYVYFLF
eukprot:m.15008 g.15008  ORF g.15008 m.15008 type:complete len:106 (+) comp7796_c0_seq1:166-483(+)